LSIKELSLNVDIHPLELCNVIRRHIVLFSQKKVELNLVTFRFFLAHFIDVLKRETS